MAEEDQARPLQHRVDLETEAPRTPEEPDWKSAVLDSFAAWLDGLTEPEGDTGSVDTGEESEPDLLSFYSELAALKQEIRLQTRAAHGASRAAEAAVEGLREALHDQQRNLSRTAESLKAVIPAARREARTAVTMELLALREGIGHAVAGAEQRRLPALPWMGRARHLLAAGARDQRMIRDKLDDALRRLDILPLAEKGVAFDARTMRAVSRTRGSGVAPGCVAEVLRQGYRCGDQILQAADVNVAVDEYHPAEAGEEDGRP